MWAYLQYMVDFTWRYRFLYRDLNDLLARNRTLEMHFKQIISHKVHFAKQFCEQLVEDGEMVATPAEIQVISTNIGVMSAAQLSRLSATSLIGLGNANIDALSASQVGALSTYTFSGMSGSQLASLDNTTLSELTFTQVSALPSGALNSLNDTQIAALQPAL